MFFQLKRIVYLKKICSNIFLITPIFAISRWIIETFSDKMHNLYNSSCKSQETIEGFSENCGTIECVNDKLDYITSGLLVLILDWV